MLFVGDCDGDDIAKIRYTLVRTDILTRQFGRCSVTVKIIIV